MRNKKYGMYDKEARDKKRRCVVCDQLKPFWDKWEYIDGQYVCQQCAKRKRYQELTND